MNFFCAFYALVGSWREDFVLPIYIYSRDDFVLPLYIYIGGMTLYYLYIYIYILEG